MEKKLQRKLFQKYLLASTKLLDHIEFIEHEQQRILKYLDEVDDVLLSILGIPEETSSKYDPDDPKYYCRDYWYDLLQSAGENPKKLEKLFNESQKYQKK